MSRRSFRVGRSKTGLGLFATKPIRKRTIIFYYIGKKITSEESERREQRGARYIFEISKKFAIDGSTRRNLGRYANHSCRPNAKSDVKKGRIFVKAMRDIKPGQEITYHYGKDYLENVLTRRGCKCTTCVRRRSRERAEYRKKAARRAKRLAALAAKAREMRKAAAATARKAAAAEVQKGYEAPPMLRAAALSHSPTKRSPRPAAKPKASKRESGKPRKPR